jgi:hypothetical protein
MRVARPMHDEVVCMSTNYAWHRMGVGLTVGALLWLGCGDESENIVGSGKTQEFVTQSMFVERVTIFMPFRTVVYNGEPRKMVVRGEDNLASLITVKETDVGSWKISAPPGLRFEQHEDIEVEIPYIDMVEIAVDGKAVQFADDPAKVWGGS